MYHRRRVDPLHRQFISKMNVYRSPEPYKGKGVRYADEVVRIKEAKKKYDSS